MKHFFCLLLCCLVSQTELFAQPEFLVRCPYPEETNFDSTVVVTARIFLSKDAPRGQMMRKVSTYSFSGCC